MLHNPQEILQLGTYKKGERGGSVVECRTPEREVRGSRPTAAVLCPWARHFTPREYWLITQEAMAPSRHDWKIVDWDVKPQHNQPTYKKNSTAFIPLHFKVLNPKSAMFSSFSLQYSFQVFLFISLFHQWIWLSWFFFTVQLCVIINIQPLSYWLISCMFFLIWVSSHEMSAPYAYILLHTPGMVYAKFGLVDMCMYPCSVVFGQMFMTWLCPNFYLINSSIYHVK